MIIIIVLQLLLFTDKFGLLHLNTKEYICTVSIYDHVAFSLNVPNWHFLLTFLQENGNWNEAGLQDGGVVQRKWS